MSELEEQKTEEKTESAVSATETPTEEQKPEEKKKKKRWLLLLLLLLLLGIVAGFVYHIVTTKHQERLQKELDAELGFLPGMSEQDIQDRLNQIVEEGRLNVSINPTPTYENGKAKGNIQIENVQGNRYSFTVAVEVVGTSDDAGAKDYVGKEIMKTGLIDPGSYVQKKQLSVDLPKGEYVCIATFTAYDKKENEVGSVGTQIMITVQN